jgi:hypothetical protein
MLAMHNGGERGYTFEQFNQQHPILLKDSLIDAIVVENWQRQMEVMN